MSNSKNPDSSQDAPHSTNETTPDEEAVKQDSLALYLQARAKVDQAVAEKNKQGGDALLCGKGCARCCTGGLEVLPVEVGAIEVYLEEEGLESLPIFQEEKCAFLDENDACSIYDARPFVCRTQGLALRMDAQETELSRFQIEKQNVAACALNFTEREPNPDEVLDLVSIQALLTMINAKFCTEFGYPISERVPLAGVAHAIQTQLIEQGILPKG